uniref:Cysteine dioxygenase n=1 Tax=Acrobeloides nanus TaxID=290746 RepID=A0A914DR09_9BILA
MESLISQVRQMFESDSINANEVMRILENYKSDPVDWQQYVIFDPHRYTRSLVDIGNGKYNLMILCWGPGTGSSIHDHASSNCYVKVLQGTLLETRYAWPKNGSEDQPMEEISRDEFDLNAVSFMHDKIGLHRMENPNHSETTISLHLYIPGYNKCTAFDERTSKKDEVFVTFHNNQKDLVK